MENLPDYVYFKDLEGRFLCINQALAGFFGLPKPETAIGKTDYDFFPHALASKKDADEREIVRTGVGFIAKEERDNIDSINERWVLSSKLPLCDDQGNIIGTFGISRDISEMKHAQEALQAQHRLLKTMVDILPCRIFVKDHEGRLRLTNVAYREALGGLDAEDIEGRRLDEIISDERVSSAASDDRAVLTGEEILNREEYDASPIGDKRWMLLSKVPLRDASGQPTGIVGMAADITAQKDAEARALAAQKELSAKNQQIEAELALARDLQTELMAASIQHVREMLDAAAPLFPKISYYYQASEHLAGDFFQLIPLSRNTFGLLICDVMGHGIKAALVTTLIRGLLADAKAKELKPGQVLDQLNDRLCVLLDRPPLPRFVTAFYAQIDIARGHLSFANAGHPWPLFHTSHQPVFPLSSDECGPALGLIRGFAYEAGERPLLHGDRLLCFTDGCSEQCSASGEEFGATRLAHAFERTQKRPTENTMPEIVAELRSWAGPSAQSDDLCIISVAF